MIFCAFLNLDNDDVISCPGYVFYNQPRSQPYSRKSGGIGFFVQQNLSASVDVIDSNSYYIAWIQISKKAHILDKDILIGAPQQLKFFNDDESNSLNRKFRHHALKTVT